jgi:hypothetical protein
VELYIKVSDNERILVGELPHGSIDEIFIPADGSYAELDDFMHLVGEKVLTALPIEYQKMCKTIKAIGRDALLAVPRNVLNDHLNDCHKSLLKTLCDTENAEYLVTYILIKRFLHGLSRVSVDRSRLSRMLNETENASVQGTLKSFLPESDGKCVKVKYSMINSATGRLTVLSGPQILTAPAGVRSCLQSDYVGGKILQVDIISAEPKFALHLKGDEMPIDVYEHISENILGGEVNRHHAKLITLCALYGQSAKNLKRHLPEGASARGVIRETRLYFDHDHLKLRLQSENRSGNFRNAVGRPLKIDDGSERLLISYYLQSSVAEGSIIMFSDFVNRFSNFCKPIFVVHDALIIDCKSEFANSLLQKKRIKLSLGDWKFDAEVKLVGDI